MKSVLPLLLFFFFAAFASSDAQTFTSVKPGNWNSADTWTLTNGCSASYPSPPPTQGYYPQCPIDIVISHTVTFSGQSEFGAGYFRSITVKGGGVLKFANDFVLSTGGSQYALKIVVENGAKIEAPNGTFKFQRNALVDIQAGGMLAVKNLEGGGGNGGTLHVRSGGSFSSSNLINLNNGLRLNIEGTLHANKLISQGGGNNIEVRGEGKFVTSGDVDINGFPFTASGDSRVTIGGNLSVTQSGNSKLYVNGNGNFAVTGKTTIANHVQVGGEAIVVMSGEVEITGSGDAMLEVRDKGDVLITSNLKKPQYSGSATVKDSGQLVICGSGIDGQPATYPPTSHANMNIAPSPAYYGGCTVMPVGFSSFTATFEELGRKSILSWTTEKEWQNSHFEIERSIDNISDWESIGEVSGNGFTDSPTSYQFKDNKLPTRGGRIYYRIKQVNFDDETSYSSARAIQAEAIEGGATWTAYPNPTQGTDFQLEFKDSSETQDSPIYVILSSIMGQQKLFYGNSLPDINSSLRMELTQKEPGIYLLKVMSGRDSQTLKIIKK